MQTKKQRDAEAALGCMILAFMALGVALVGLIGWAIVKVVLHFT